MFKTRKSGEARVLAAGKQGMGRIPLAHTCPGVVRYTPRPGFANGAMSALQPSPRGRRLPKIHTKGMAWRVASREPCTQFLAILHRFYSGVCGLDCPSAALRARHFAAAWLQHRVTNIKRLCLAARACMARVTRPGQNCAQPAIGASRRGDGRLKRRLTTLRGQTA